MKIHAQVGDADHNVEIKREGRKVIATVDDRSYELDVSEPEPGDFLFKHDGKIYEASVDAQKTEGGTTHVRIGRNEFDVRLFDPKRLRGSGSEVDHAKGPAEIMTAMPGKVVRVLVEAGTEVLKGDGVMIVEAMKMQNELKAPRTGVVNVVRVKEGDTVAAGEILATIE